DDGDMKPDAADEVVNGANDLKDLARIKLLPWKEAPAAATAQLTVEDAVAAAAVRLFRDAGSGFAPLAAPDLTAADLISGGDFAIEAKDFPQSSMGWDGYAVLHLVVSDGKKTVVDDKVKMRVAPYVLINNTSDLATVWESTFSDFGGKA